MALSTPSKLSQFETGKPETTKAPGKYTVRTLGNAAGRFFKLFVYGKQGTGKTFLLVSLLLDGQKIFVISTDVGGDGLATVEAELRYLGREDLLQNIAFVCLPNYDAVHEFMKAPDRIWPDIYTWDPDFLCWDGFSNWQQIALQEEVETDESVMKAMEAGSPLKYWGAMKRETQREYDKFLNLHNKKTGKLWHKIVTCLEDDKHTEEQLKNITDEKEKLKTPKQGKGPMVQGAAGKLMGPGCDMVLRLIKKTKRNEDSKKLETTFWYETAGTDKIEAKVRGLKLDPLVPADFGAIWKLVKQYYGLVQGAVDTELVEASNG